MSTLTTDPRPAAAGGGPEVALLWIDDMDQTQVLLHAQRLAYSRHQRELEDLEVAVQFARLNSADPGETRGAGAGIAGGPRLVQVGGDGTPMVLDLPICELAIARRVHETTERNHLAAALDLTYRMPKTLLALRAGRGEVWVARKITTMSRHLDRKQIRQVDEAVSKAMDQAPGRVLNIADAAIMRADPEHARKVEAEKRRRRYVALGRCDERGLRKIFALIDDGDALWLDAVLDRVADALEQRPDLIPDLIARAEDDGAAGYTRDELRAEALGWLAHPEDVIALLNGSYPVRDSGSGFDGQATAPSRQRSSRQQADVHVHLSQAAVEAYLSDQTTDVVARVEDLGPMLLDQLRRLLAHAEISLKPVIDLNENRSVNGYEHPPDVSERGYLRMAGDAFPHAQNQSRNLDDDHPKPYQPKGPPGQTGDHNQAPLGRRGHRAKTFHDYRVDQIGLGRYVWRTPHGLYRLVDGTGTHVIDESTATRLIDGDSQ